jgi:hypothetical protein
MIHPADVRRVRRCHRVTGTQSTIAERLAMFLVTGATGTIGQPSRYNGDRSKEVEDAAASGLEWVSLRASSFAINGGEVVHGPYAGFTEASIHEGDLAGVVDPRAPRPQLRRMGRRPRGRLPGPNDQQAHEPWRQK